MHADENITEREVEYPLIRPGAQLTLNKPLNPPLMLTEGEGCLIRDDSGNEYVDANAGLWNTHIGQGNAEVINAIEEQLRRLSYGTLFARRTNGPAVQLAQELRSLMPDQLPFVFLTGSGSESVEVALRLAVVYKFLQGDNSRAKIVYLDESFHGTFNSCISVSGTFPIREIRELYDDGNTIALPTPNPLRCPPEQSYDEFAIACADALEEPAKTKQVGAFIVEPILGSSVTIPPRGYFERIQAICHQYDILLIVDEVATGFGRTGRWFAFEHYDLAPDMVLLSKGINSGYLPLGAVVFSRRIADVFLAKSFPMPHASTTNGHPVCCASALANIEILRREGLIERSRRMGEYLLRSLEPLSELPVVKEIRGLGLMIGILLMQADGSNATDGQLWEVHQLLKRMGVLLYFENSTLSLSPALTIAESEIDFVVAALRSVLSIVELRNDEVRQIGSLPERVVVPQPVKMASRVPGRSHD